MDGRGRILRALGKNLEDRDRASAAFVPRVLRRFSRLFAKLLSGKAQVPNHLGSLACAGFFAVAFGYGVVAGGHLQACWHVLGSAVGLGVADVDINGHRKTSDIDVIGALALDGSTSLPGLSVRHARESLEALPWVKSAEVKKVYPQALRIAISEYVPFALWQQGTQLTVIDEEGHVIGPASSYAVSGLPLVVGLGAELSAAEILASTARYPDLFARTKAFVRVGDRRWNLLLNSGVVVKLPDEAMNLALAELDALNGASDLFDKDIRVIDLRLRDRVAVELSEGAAQVHRDRVEELVKSGRGA